MKHLIFFSLLFAFVPSFSQQWLFQEYSISKKAHNELTISENINAFDKYWSAHKVGKGRGFMAFGRWKEFVQVRSSGMDKLPSDIFFSEWLKTKSERSSSGNWQYIGADDTPLQINTGERSGSGRVNAIAFDPTDPDVIYLGSPAGGLWKTLNGGLTWETKTDLLPSIGVSDIAVNPLNPDQVYIATGDADASDTYTCGLLRSDDGGNTWQTTAYNPSVSQNNTISRVLINPNFPDSILISTNSSIRLSSNGAVNFTIVKTGNYRDMKYKPGNPSVVYASSYSYYGSAKLIKSVNGGNDWTDISPPAEDMDSVSRIAIAVTEANPEVIYLLTVRASGNNFYALFRSSDGGATWEKKYSYLNKNLLGYESDGSDDAGQGWYDLALAVSPVNENMVIVGGVNLWRSINGGSTFNIIGHWWGDMADYVHADQHIAKYQPGTNYLFAGNDGGFYRSMYNGNDWSDLSDGLQIMQIYRMSVASHGQDQVICGTQDNGTMLKMSYMWNFVMGGDGMDCLIDYNEPGIMYGEYYYGSLYRTVNGGYSWDDIKPQQAKPGSWITPLAMDPDDPNTIYAGYEDIYKTTDQGNTWDAISSALLDSELVKILVVAQSDHNIIVAGKENMLKKTTDGGNTWSSIYSTSFNGQLTSVCISPSDPSKMWATISGYVASKKVYYSSNGGTTWTSVSTGLPNVPVNCIVYEPQSPDRVYAGTDLGVYVKDTVLSTWIPFKTGLPNTIINDLEISHGQIIAATYGRGLWYSDLLTEYPQSAELFDKNFLCNVYPVPANEILYLSVPGNSGKKCTYIITSADGRIVQNGTIENSYNTIDVSGLSNGIYLLSVSSNDGYSVNKIQILRK